LNFEEISLSLQYLSLIGENDLFRRHLNAPRLDAPRISFDAEREIPRW
jgi:hypothetical protein